MKAAIIVMTILGCDDSATQCHYIDTADRSWQTVALCDAQAEAYINRHQNSNYPVIVAVCESAGDRMTAEIVEPAPETGPEGTATAGTDTPEPGLTGRTLGLVRQAIPDVSVLKTAVSKPVHYIEDGYSWVVRRFAD